MQVMTKAAGNYLIVTLRGTLDETCAGSLQNELGAWVLGKAKNLLIDFGGVVQVTAGGLRLLLPYVQKLQQQKKKMIVFNLKAAHLQVISSSGFDSLVTVADSLDNAMKSVGVGASK